MRIEVPAVRSLLANKCLGKWNKEICMHNDLFQIIKPSPVENPQLGD